VHVEQPVRGSRRAVLLWPDPCALDPLDTGKLPGQRDLIGIAGLEHIRALGVVVNNTDLRTHESPLTQRVGQRAVNRSDSGLRLMPPERERRASSRACAQ